jgi:glycosyltransferase involved in cell wall biosynthesis
MNETIHATVSNQFAKQIGAKYSWPPLIWSDEFKKPLDKSIIKKTRNEWLEKSFLQNKRTDFDGFALFCGRWSYEKRIDLLIKNTPRNILLVVVGNSLNEDAVSFVEKCGKEKDNVLLLKSMVDSKTLHEYYKSTDLYMSASNFETCGNTLIESWTCGTPVAVQPEQGHLEWLNDGKNGFAIDFDSKNCEEEITNAFKNRNNLSKLETTSDYFKTFNFYEEFYRNIIIPCLKIKKSKVRRFLNLIACIFVYFSVFLPTYLITNLLQYTSYKTTIQTNVWKYIEE